MKKQLLTALLALAPFLVAAQPTNAELLAHLKNAQIIIKNGLQELSCYAKKLEQKLGKDYKISVNIFNDLVDIMLFNEIYSKIEKIAFYQLRHEIKPIHNCFDILQCCDDETGKRILNELNIEDFNEKILEQDNQFFSTIHALIEKHSSENDIRTYEEKMKSLISSYESTNLLYVIINTKTLTALLQDIENKIQELQAA